MYNKKMRKPAQMAMKLVVLALAMAFLAACIYDEGTYTPQENVDNDGQAQQSTYNFRYGTVWTFIAPDGQFRVDIDGFIGYTEPMLVSVSSGEDFVASIPVFMLDRLDGNNNEHVNFNGIITPLSANYILLDVNASFRDGGSSSPQPFMHRIHQQAQWAEAGYEWAEEVDVVELIQSNLHKTLSLTPNPWRGGSTPDSIILNNWVFAMADSADEIYQRYIADRQFVGVGGFSFGSDWQLENAIGFPAFIVLTPSMADEFLETGFLREHYGWEGENNLYMHTQIPGLQELILAARENPNQ